MRVLLAGRLHCCAEVLSIFPFSAFLFGCFCLGALHDVITRIIQTVYSVSVLFPAVS
jgi:hypothetical protein